MLDVLRAAGHQARLASGGDDCGGGVQLRFDSGEHAVDEVNGAVVKAGLNVGDRVGADDL